ncbi:galactose mutarotase-like domain-containing protein [Xylariaceae sp. FL0255]|nr:galactose mutarotase-like domain-containing protein [Xylariaceae sp. FL0255]
MVGPKKPDGLKDLLKNTPDLPKAQVNISHDNSRVSAVLPTNESVEVLMYGATVISWKDKDGNEKLFLSDAAKLDGTKAVRGGIPLVFPVFGTAPDHAATSKLPQHGFARNSKWEFLGSSPAESNETTDKSDVGVKLDFGLSSATLGPRDKVLWPHDFTAIYTVTLSPNGLGTGIAITNDGEESFDCQVLMHTYLRIKDITKVTVSGLKDSSYVDKVDGAKTKTETSDAISITGETDRVYNPKGGPAVPVVVKEDGVPAFKLVRDNLQDLVVWNPWVDKAAGMGDFEPKDGYKNMICVEAGTVGQWVKLDPGDVLNGHQTISY